MFPEHLTLVLHDVDKCLSDHNGGIGHRTPSMGWCIERIPDPSRARACR
jgi:hypothetical protein